MKTFRLFSMAALALVMAACSNEDNEIEQQPAQQLSKIYFSATIAPPNSGAKTRTLYSETGDGYINVKWRAKVDGGYEGDKLALIHGGNMDIVTVTSVNDDGRAVIEGSITKLSSDEEDVVLVYPAAAVESATPQAPLPYTPSATYVLKGFNQGGTLDYIQNNLDGRQGNGTLKKVSDSKVTLKEDVSMPSKIAIWKLSLENKYVTGATAALSATSVTIKVGGTRVAATATGTAKSEYYLCLVPATMGSGDLTIEATDGTNTYSYTKAGGATSTTFTAGEYYKSTVSMYTLGYVICTDRSIYPTVTVAQNAGKIPVGKIVYLGNNTGHSTHKNGLALSLIDVGFDESNDWANTYCSRLNTNQSTAYANPTTAVTGAEWMLPTKPQWETMISAAGGFANLRDGFGSVGGTNMRTIDDNSSDSYYWTNTLLPEETTYWYSINSYECVFSNIKNSAHKKHVRACLAF